MSKTQQNNKKLQRRYEAEHALVNYYLLLMFTAFPLFFTNAYFHIRRDKFYFFIILTGVIIIAVSAIMVYSYYSQNNKSNPNDTIFKSLFGKMTFTDYAVLAFLAVCIISAILSNHTSDAMSGAPNGRNNGLILMIFYVGIYFVITRCYYYMEYVFVALAAGSAVVYLLSVLNFHYIDPLGMYTQLSSSDIENFTSTIGNKNLLSSFICVMLPVTVTMSVHSKNLILRIIYLVSSGLGFMALMTADSDSGILGMGVIFAVMLVWYSRKIFRLKRYFLCLTVMLVSAKILYFFSSVLTLVFDFKTKGFDEFQKLFVESDMGYLLAIFAAVITGVLYLIDFKIPNLTLSKAVPVTLGILFVLAALAIIAVVIYFSVFDTTTDLGSLETILRFNEKWGTHRGFMWIRSFDIFKDFNPFQKLFGTGPDTFFYAFAPYFSELRSYGDSSTNAAHNEYINYLITIGVTGLASYICIIAGTIVRAIKKSFCNPISIVCVSAVICYAVQSVVNIAQPITTPLFILFIALTETVSRNNAENSDLN